MQREQLGMLQYLSLVIIGVMLLLGCGQKGDLYLPEPPRETPSTAAEE